jgi:hypothetical protein
MANLRGRRPATVLAVLLLVVAVGLVRVSTRSAPGLLSTSPPTAPGAAAGGSGLEYQPPGVEVVRWTDNSFNEDGFRIRIEIPGTQETYTFDVPANATSFAIPNSLPLGCARYEGEPSRGSYWITVSAYNAAGESQGPKVGHMGNCPTPIPRTPTPAAPR